MPRARKKPVEIEYHHLISLNFDDSHKIAQWCNGNVKEHFFDGVHEAVLSIQTLEGEMLGRAGDYIIEGVNGEFYPCKPDIFEKTYDLIED